MVSMVYAPCISSTILETHGTLSLSLLWMINFIRSRMRTTSKTMIIGRSRCIGLRTGCLYLSLRNEDLPLRNPRPSHDRLAATYSMVHVMSEVKQFSSSEIAVGNASGLWVHYEDFDRKEFELDAARNRIDVERQRADTAEAEVQRRINNFQALKRDKDSLQVRYEAAEQRIAALVTLAQRMIAADKILEFWTSNEVATEAEFEYQEAFGALKAALNPNPEAESHE